MKLSSLLKRFAAMVAITFSAGSFAADLQINADGNDLAIHGYDAVSYFSKSGPVEGSAEYTASYKDAIYRFANAKNRDSFRADPEKYAPQFGGYCAMGVALNQKLDIDPMAYRVVDGKLYLNLNKQVQKKWMEDIPGNIETAERNWHGIHNLTAAQLAAE
ncbi:MAG: YHS domain-containing (seleno)protein [Haliea sp.]|uniref:YHS domain-containing (seleno)protein n=1 Tax=Marinobacter salarius TaxID=1420917 RepID=UPI0032F01A74